ncbi:MAG: LacI family transcriptional regulator [Lachnospiraceae bacterium]|nr:LacI family transcriptional regulator [Lachnospiraceae bacterium]
MSTERITIDDVAEALNISKTTVSRAISGKGRISNATRAKVMEYIDLHNYRPSSLAQGLAKKRTFNIAVVWPKEYSIVDLPFFQRCLIGIDEITSANDNDIIVCMMKNNDIHQLERLITNNKIDGVILTRTLIEDKACEYLNEKGLPFVAIGNTIDNSIITVDNDHFKACRELTMILLQKGFESIALIGGDENHVITTIRYEGYSAAFRDFGKKMDTSLTYFNISTLEQVSDIVKELYEKKTDCIICMDDSICGNVINACKEQNINIPSDLKIASFYDSAVLENVNPSITSLRFDDRALGRRAAQTLLDMIDKKEVNPRTLSNYQVVLQQSTQ